MSFFINPIEVTYAQNQMIKLFNQFVRSIHEENRADFFDSRNDWQSAFANYILEWRKETGAPND